MNRNLDEHLAAIGEDPADVFHAFAAEMAKPAGRRHEALVAELRNRIGSWPHPDTPDDEILRNAGRVGLPVGQILRRLEAWPAPYRREAVIAELRARGGDHPHAQALNPL